MCMCSIRGRKKSGEVNHLETASLHCAKQWRDGRKHSFDDKETNSDKQLWLVGLSGTQEKLDRQEGQVDLSGPSFPGV